MESPKRMYLDYEGDWHDDKTLLDTDEMLKYIRSDLVDKLIGYAVHDRDCDQEVGWGKTTRCTCGLSDLIKELRG